jgi:class 3 adenylate cyclase
LPTERPNRRLTTILAADAAGYSRLVGVDEEGTLERVRAIRKDLIDPVIAAHRGRIVKTTGDGLLVEFASVVDAVRSAIEMQRAMADSNACLASDKRMAVFACLARPMTKYVAKLISPLKIAVSST